MHKYIILLLTFYIFLNAFSCDPAIDENFIDTESCFLADELDEISGMISHNDNILAFGDGGSAASLFEIDSSCLIAREFKIEGATNHDWEAIADDDQFIYIGDIGNNAGKRKDLNILKISKDQLNENTPVHSRIDFSYEDQLEFGQDELHNFDCEAMVVDGNKIFLFTKNRGNHVTHIYELNTTDSLQIARRVTEIEISDLVTGAYYDRTQGRVILMSYDRFWEDGLTAQLYYFDFDSSQEEIISNITERHISNDSQIESICIQEGFIHYASEAEKFGNAELHLFLR